MDYSMSHSTNSYINNNKDIKKENNYNINKYTKIVNYSQTGKGERLEKSETKDINNVNINDILLKTKDKKKNKKLYEYINISIQYVKHNPKPNKSVLN